MRLMNWFGAEANARAIGGLIGVGGAIGAVVVFVWTYFVTPAFPEVGIGPYADGYRAAKRITELEQRVAALEHQIEIMEDVRKTDEEVESMTDDNSTKSCQRLILNDLRQRWHKAHAAFAIAWQRPYCDTSRCNTSRVYRRAGAHRLLHDLEATGACRSLMILAQTPARRQRMKRL